MNSTATSNMEFSMITIPNSFFYIDLVTTHIELVSKKIGFKDTEINDIISAANEAVTNVIKHAYDPGEYQLFNIIIKEIPFGVKIIVKDKGIPFDPDRIIAYKPARIYKSGTSFQVAENGYGIYMMKQLMDEVYFENLGCEGKETHLIKYLNNKDIKEYFNDTELKPYGKKVLKNERQTDNYYIRGFLDHDAIEISKCAYKLYGYSYLYDHIYYPNRIIELNHNKFLISAVACSENNNSFMGHVALGMPSHRSTSAEMGMGVVKPEYKRSNCLNRISLFLIDKARELGLSGIYTRSHTKNIYFQNESHRLKAKDCAILLGHCPATMIFDKDESNARRNSLLISYLHFNKHDVHELYTPANHTDIVEKIYRNIGIKCIIKTFEKDQRLPEKSKIKIVERLSLGYVRFEITVCGENTVSNILAQVKNYCLKQIEIFHIFINMSDPFSPEIIAELEKGGFFFSGVIPCSYSGNSLVLQYLNNVIINYSDIKLKSVFAKKLYEYIRENDPNLT